MTEPSSSSIYSIDSSSLMDWQARYYPFDVFPGLVSRMESLGDANRLISPGIVHDEIKSIGTAELITWAKSHSKLFVPTAEVLQEAQTIQNQFTGLRDPKAEYEEADA